MADIPQVLANYDALVGVALGAGLTYGFGALNRRHQEKREDATRWYQVRLQAYSEFSKAMLKEERLTRRGKLTDEHTRELISTIENAGGMIRLVGTTEVIEAMGLLFAVMTPPNRDDNRFEEVMGQFETAARKDLGHPSL